MGEVFSLRERKSMGITAKRCIAPLLALMVLMGGLLVASQPQSAYADEGRDAAPQTLVVTDSPARSTADSAYDFRARLTAWANNGATSVAGVWSSDCAGSYPSINA